MKASMTNLKKLESLERRIEADRIEAYGILKSMHIPSSHAEGALKT